MHMPTQHYHTFEIKCNQGLDTADDMEMDKYLAPSAPEFP